MTWAQLSKIVHNAVILGKEDEHVPVHSNDGYTFDLTGSLVGAGAEEGDVCFTLLIRRRED